MSRVFNHSIRTLLLLGLFGSHASFAGDAFFASDDLLGTINENPAPAPAKPVAPAAEPAPAPVVTGTEVKFTAAAGYKIRDPKGRPLCNVAAGSEVVAFQKSMDGAAIKIRTGNKKCPEGWIYKNGLRAERMQAEVEEWLTLRETSKPNGKGLCGLPPGTTMSVIETTNPKSAERARVKVRVLADLPPSCPVNEGWVHGAYIRPVDAYFSDLPIDSKFESEEEDADAVSEGQFKGCNGPECLKPNIQDLRDVAMAVKNLADIDSWPKNSRGLVEMPVAGERGQIGFCGSYHHIGEPDDFDKKGWPADTYVDPTTACAFMSVLQDWKKNHCPDSSKGCTVSWGDIAHKTKAIWEDHQEHNDGHCIDIRPMRKGGFVDSPLSKGWKAYDAKKTQEFVEFLKTKGADKVIHGSGDHRDHIHVCFVPGPNLRNSCANYQYDANLCEAR